ncbi:TetR/AcrR family transcriptional regulator [Paenibacillus xylanilyticus]
MQTTIEAICDLGYAQASIGQIAKRAGVSKGVITYHFPSKDELMQKIVEELYLKGASFMSEIATESTAANMLRRYIETNLEFILAHKNHVAAVAEIVMNFRDEEGRLIYHKPADNSIYVPIIEILHWGQEDGSFRPILPSSAQVLAMTIRSAIDLASQQLVANPDFNIQEYAKELIQLFEAATGKPPI